MTSITTKNDRPSPFSAPAELGDGELAGRCAIITGASRGIGAATARRLARSGARLVLTGRNLEVGEAVAASIGDGGGEARFVRADQGTDADWATVMDEARNTFGRVDILVLNAGVSEMAATVDLSLEAFRALCRTNLKGAFLGLKHAVAAMRRGGRGGSVVMISSIAGRIGVADHIHYTASKAGVAMLAKAAALELGPEKIRVNTIYPGFVRTEMTQRFPAEMIAAAPLGRAAEPEEIAAAAAFLASDRSIFMTGAEIVIDGGWTCQ